MHLGLNILVVVLFYILTISVYQETHCLHLTSNNISVDISVDYDKNQTNAKLECHYDLDDDSLYSIIWYKDGREFYRFYPDRSPKSQSFKVNGVNVDISKSNATVVFLTSFDESTSGSYRFDAYGIPTRIYFRNSTSISTKASDSINSCSVHVRSVIE